MNIFDAFVAVILDLAQRRLHQAKLANTPQLYEYYIQDVVALHLLARAVRLAEDPLYAVERVTDGLRNLVIQELIANGLVSDENDEGL